MVERKDTRIIDSDEIDNPLDDIDLNRSHLKAPGDIIGERFEVQDILGEGGMGVAYLARDSVLEDEIALKVLNPELSRNKKYRQRFFREARLTRKITHPNIVRTYDLGIDKPSGLVYLSMEYVPGTSLDWLIETGNVGEEFLPYLFSSLCKGLDAIHEENIIHRDIKPENILVRNDGVVKIADLGIARPFDSEMTAHDEFLGSSAYTAPETWTGESCSKAIDFYALGITLFYTCTRELPFVARTQYEMMHKHVCEELPCPYKLNPELRYGISELIHKLVEKEPEDRFQSGAAAIEFLKDKMRSEPAKVAVAQPQIPKEALMTAEGKRVLVVDDEDGIRNLVGLVLSTDGYRVNSAECAETAFDLLEEGESNCDYELILLDVQMPGIGGLEFLSRFRRQYEASNVPIILLTCKSEPEDMMQGYSLGADYYIPKPFTREQLLYGINLALEGTA